MTEAEWLSCDNPSRMMSKVLRRGVTRRSSEPGGNKDWANARQLRLFCVACVALRPETSAGLLAHWIRDWGEDGQPLEGESEDLHEFSTWSQLQDSLDNQPRTADILREIIGNPFGPEYDNAADPLDDSFRAIYRLKSRKMTPQKVGPPFPAEEWEGVVPVTPLIFSLAQAAYADCHDGCLDSTRLLILADALEEAGCTEELILRHLRNEEPRPYGSPPMSVYGWKTRDIPHVRGCWVLDLLLDRR